jgi:D-glycero-D-manno-heptose 1,7-bisphosphate phosphatase
MPLEELQRMNRALREAVTLDDLRICMHDDGDGCPCRKPKPGMVLDLARHWQIDLGRSYLVGDSSRRGGRPGAARCC